MVSTNLKLNRVKTSERAIHIYKHFEIYHYNTFNMGARKKSIRYYVLLRWLTSAAGLFMAYRAYIYKKENWIWLFGFIAILFNPFFPVHLGREIWQIVNVITAIIFLISIRFVK